MTSVREVTPQVARQNGITTWSGNPGSTVVEESLSSRDAPQLLVPARRPPGFRTDRLAEALGAAAVRVGDPEHLAEVLDEVMPGLRGRDQTLVMDVLLEAAP